VSDEYIRIKLHRNIPSTLCNIRRHASTQKRRSSHMSM